MQPSAIMAMVNRSSANQCPHDHIPALEATIDAQKHTIAQAIFH